MFRAMPKTVDFHLYVHARFMSGDTVMRTTYDMFIMEIPSEHQKLTQSWFNISPPSTTLGQHETNIGSTSHVCWVCICEEQNRE